MVQWIFGCVRWFVVVAIHLDSLKFCHVIYDVNANSNVVVVVVVRRVFGASEWAFLAAALSAAIAQNARQILEKFAEIC